jgi:2-isopropylmalate synthase
MPYENLASFSVRRLEILAPDGSVSFVFESPTVKVWLGEERRVEVAEGNGPVNAIDTALRRAILGRYPELAKVHLTDYKVRILDGATATGAITRVLIDATNGDRSWTTIGVSANIIEASWRALEESLVYGLLHTGD